MRWAKPGTAVGGRHNQVRAAGTCHAEYLLGRVSKQLDLDSMDFLIAVDEHVEVDMPEKDCGKLRTLNDCLRYLQERLSAQTL